MVEYDESVDAYADVDSNEVQSTNDHTSDDDDASSYKSSGYQSSDDSDDDANDDDDFDDEDDNDFDDEAVVGDTLVRINSVTSDEIRSMEFGSVNEAYEFYYQYGKCKGFAIRKSDEKKRGPEGNKIVVMKQFVCSKQGARDKKHIYKLDRKREHRRVTRTNCTARLRVVYKAKKDRYVVTVFDETHNHELTPARYMHLHPSCRNISEADRAQIDGLQSHGIRTCHIMGYMVAQKGGYAGVGFTKKDLYNYFDKKMRDIIKDGDVAASLNYLNVKSSSDPMLYCEYAVEDSKDCDSTASTPKQPKEKKAKKQFPATERKAAKKKLCDKLGSTSAPPILKDIKEWTRLLEDNQYKKINKILFCQPEEEDDNDSNINFHPSKPIGYEFFDTGFPIPEWMPVTFRPTPMMNLNEICAYTTAYVFMRDDEQQHGGEVLIKSTSDVVGDRKALKTLMPRCGLDQEIINLVVARSNWLIESLGKRKSVWYLPTQFAQYAVDDKYKADYIRSIYQEKFMPTNSIVSKIFIPMNDEGAHWYLVVIDFNERKVVWLDSLPSDERYLPRRHSILRVLMKVEEILRHRSYDQLNLVGPDNLITNYSILEPKYLPHQRPGSNDCGVWVSKWMIECPLRSNYGNITVVTATRLKLALFLCHSSNNLLLQSLLTKSAQYWADMERKRKFLVNV